ncbi:hypothetical protein E2C01_040651 [Portunus trituberculatus]|uniref:Uncharacterized protein n=1 Tax=Portunus trituberculatus TaxID=210409 RepID=A0A5B7FH89_PORTR|nr:hypothetical protein [Portunus trituberculatus]
MRKVGPGVGQSSPAWRRGTGSRWCGGEILLVGRRIDARVATGAGRGLIMLRRGSPGVAAFIAGAVRQWHEGQPGGFPYPLLRQKQVLETSLRTLSVFSRRVHLTIPYEAEKQLNTGVNRYLGTFLSVTSPFLPNEKDNNGIYSSVTSQNEIEVQKIIHHHHRHHN